MTMKALFCTLALGLVILPNSVAAETLNLSCAHKSYEQYSVDDGKVFKLTANESPMSIAYSDDEGLIRINYARSSDSAYSNPRNMCLTSDCAGGNAGFSIRHKFDELKTVTLSVNRVSGAATVRFDSRSGSYSEMKYVCTKIEQAF